VYPYFKETNPKLPTQRKEVEKCWDATTGSPAHLPKMQKLREGGKEVKRGELGIDDPQST
jgi:hypothetical protein